MSKAALRPGLLSYFPELAALALASLGGLFFCGTQRGLRHLAPLAPVAVILKRQGVVRVCRAAFMGGVTSMLNWQPLEPVGSHFLSLAG
jgi:hypothetical protein